MITHDVESSSQGVGSLVSGIVSDVQDLLSQQLTLFQQELKHHLIKTKKTVFPLLVGLTIALVAGIILSAAVALLLYENAHLSLAASFGIVGAVVVIAAGILISIGVREAERFDSILEKSAQEGKETIQWLTKK